MFNCFDIQLKTLIVLSQFSAKHWVLTAGAAPGGHHRGQWRHLRPGAPRRPLVASGGPPQGLHRLQPRGLHCLHSPRRWNGPGISQGKWSKNLSKTFLYIFCKVFFFQRAESKGLIADIVYEKIYSPSDGIISSHEVLHPIKVIRFRPQNTTGDTQAHQRLSDIIYF